MNDPRHAFFDLDGTLLPWDTQMLFCHRILRKQRWRFLLLLPFFAVAPLAVTKLVRSRFLKRMFLGYLAGMPREELEREAAEFAREVAERHVWPEMRAEVERHRAEGRVLTLNTASPDFYGRPIAEALGFDHCFATRVVVGARCQFFPEIIGPNNKRAAKIAAMKDAGLLPHDFAPPAAESWAYTDSIVDLPLLACADHGALVHPKAALAEHPGAAHCVVLRPSPAPGRMRKLVTLVRLLTGIGSPPYLD